MLVGGALADRPSRLVGAGEPVEVAELGRRYVSRGGYKLAAALDRFQIEVGGVRALDAGASTGGFTDCLIQRGAAGVVAVDVGYGQLDARLRSDPRVVVMERTNVRLLEPDLIPGGKVELVTADLSFISLRLVASVLAGSLGVPGATLVVLVKPQFEVGRAEISRGKGVVRDPAAWARALRGATSAFETAGAAIMGVMCSPLLGPAGNAEFLLHAVTAAGSATGHARAPGPMIEAAIDEATARTSGAGHAGRGG